MKTNRQIMNRSSKSSRQYSVLIGLIELYLDSGKPIGSNTLHESGFENLSSATIRNYFSSLEKEGFLTQQHSSGGRIPTNKALRLYAHENLTNHPTPLHNPELIQTLDSLKNNETREITSFLQQSAETLSDLTQTAIFLSAPRFDHDFISMIRLIGLDTKRCLCIIITDFGVIHTEILHPDFKLTTHAINRIEGYFQWRLRGIGKPENLTEEEKSLAQKFYNEVIVRYIIGYSNFIDEDIYRTGFSKLLHYTEFQDSSSLANCLALFENAHSMRLLLRDALSHNDLRVWIGEDLLPYTIKTPDSTVIAIPYHINQNPAGAIGMLGPTRIPYKEYFNLLRAFSRAISDALTRSVYKFKITYRQPTSEKPFLPKEQQLLLGQSPTILLEDKRKK